MRVTVCCTFKMRYAKFQVFIILDFLRIFRVFAHICSQMFQLSELGLAGGNRRMSGRPLKSIVRVWRLIPRNASRIKVRAKRGSLGFLIRRGRGESAARLGLNRFVGGNAWVMITELIARAPSLFIAGEAHGVLRPSQGAR